MKKTFFLISPVLCLLACNISTSPENNATVKLDSIRIGRETMPEIKHYSGLYRAHQSNFLDCESGKLFVLKNAGTLDSLYNLILPNAYTDEAVYIEMNASLEADDPNAIFYSDGIKAEQKNYKNTCIQADFWCTGFEPFWIVQISEGEALIDFYNPMEQKTTHFVFAKPEIKNGLTVYKSTDGENKISVIIKKEKCNGAIDKQYDYSAQVQLNDKKYNGCAIK